MISKTPDLLIRTLQESIDQKSASLKKQILALEELFSMFTTERTRMRRTSYLDIPKYRNAYLRYHVPLNFARAACALTQVRKVYPEVDRLEEIVDLGAGPGSASLASLYTLPPTPARRYTLYDRSRAALKVARHLLDSNAKRGDAKSPAVTEIRTHAASLPPLPRIPSAALVWMSMLLNELGVGDRKGPTLTNLAARLTTEIPPGSVLLLVEPALRAPGRDLLRLHDALVLSRAWQVLAPCTHNRECPLLRVKGNSWCHFHFEWQPAEYVRRVAAPLGLSPSSSSLAFLAVKRTDSISDKFKGCARIIGDVMKVRNDERGVYVCKDGKRQLLSPPPRPGGRGDIVETRENGKHRRLVSWRHER